jgi:hypothetical protein
MNKLLVTLVASAFTFASASGFAADAMKKKEELTAEQKTEIRDRAERLKAERAKADQAKATTPATPAPAKKAEPKRTSKAKSAHGKTATRTLGKKAPAKV